MPTATITEAVRSGRVLVSDGAWGTFLQRKGMRPGECPELWNVERAADIEDIARSYVDAGADMIQTDSFGANRFKLRHYGLESRAADLNEAAARISRRVAGPQRWVIASMGPTGEILLMGDVSAADLHAAFAEQAAALERGGADALCIETMSALDEAIEAIRAARDTTRCEVICTFTFNKTKDGYRTMMGLAPGDAARGALDAGAHIVGANCGNGIERMIEIVTEMRAAASDAPILVHANAGIPTNKDGVDVFPESPADMATRIPALVDAGANVVGGCCGTPPEHIAAIRAAVDARRAAPR